LRLPDDAVLYPPCVAKFLLKDVDVRLGRRVIALREDGVTLDDGSQLHAGTTVLACGALAGELVPGIAVHPRKGHLLITDRYPGYLRHQLIELGYLKSAHAVSSDSVAFNVQPRKTGQVLIGSSRQYGVDDPAVESHMLEAMLRRAVEYMPDIGELSAVRAWTGFRAATPDKLPLIGVCPGYRNVYLATGHEGLGISTSLATAQLLVDLTTGRESAIPRQPYAPDRSFA
jgi:glycine/D-amino acid oxidase-like deaminating enzyme